MDSTEHLEHHCPWEKLKFNIKATQSPSEDRRGRRGGEEEERRGLYTPSRTSLSMGKLTFQRENGERGWKDLES